MDFLNWFMDPNNLILAAGVYAAALGLLQAVVRITPTTKDDSWPSKIGGLAEGLRNILQVQKPSSPTDDQNQ